MIGDYFEIEKGARYPVDCHLGPSRPRREEIHKGISLPPCPEARILLNPFPYLFPILHFNGIVVLLKSEGQGMVFYC